MSLLSFRDAEPWAESIREQLLSQAMPPVFADPFGPTLGGHRPISARELDILLTWATGGAPEGDGLAPEEVEEEPVWPLGEPDRVLPLPVFTVPGGVEEDVQTFRLAAAFTSPTRVRGADLMPGDPSMVRSATIAVEGGEVLAEWQPGASNLLAPAGVSFRVPAAATLTVTVRYKKNWRHIADPRTDRSTVGLYVASASAAGGNIGSVAIGLSDRQRPNVRTAVLKRPARVLAFRVAVSTVLESVALDAVLPNRQRVGLGRLQAVRPHWTQRYWLATPVELPEGTRLEATLVEAPIARMFGSAPTVNRLDVDFVALPR